MKSFFRYLLPLVAACGLSTTAAFADTVSDSTERDSQAVKHFIRSKRAVNVDEVSGNISISGDVRTEWKHLREKHDGSPLRGSGSGGATGALYGSNEFDVEFNLYIDYVTECTWATVHLDFDNNMGANACVKHSGGANGDALTDGQCDQICLRKAYMGYNVFQEGTCRFDIEVGRRELYSVFDSRVQFQNRFDGILLRYSTSFECVCDFYVYGGMFVGDSVIDDYNWVIELGAMDIMDSGVDFKYSYIDWKAGKTDRAGVTTGQSFSQRHYESQNSQFTLAYSFDPEFICNYAKVYGAWIINHAAEKRTQSNDKKKDMAWYLGVTFGDAKRCGDFSVDINYQHVEAQAISDCDMSGIGRGNVGKVGFAEDNAQGNGNFAGFAIEVVYLITDNITANVEYEFSEEESSAIGGTHDYNKFELELIYAW